MDSPVVAVAKDALLRAKSGLTPSGMHKQMGVLRGAGHMQPLELTAYPHPCFIKVADRGFNQLRFNLLLNGSNRS